jgi:molybdopterin synthase sulfur carrier subunit
VISSFFLDNKHRNQFHKLIHRGEIMNIKVFANFREICEGKVVTIDHVDDQPVISVLDALIERYPPMEEELFTEEKELKPMIHVFVNGKNIIHLEGLKTTVYQSDQIALFPPVAGG